jgi:uncharacterized protein
MPIILCLGLIFVYPLLVIPLQMPLHELVLRAGRNEARFAAEAFVWLYAAAVLAIALFWERRTPASIGLRRITLASLGFGIGALAAIYVVGGIAGYVVYFVLHEPERAPAQVAALLGGSLLYALSLGVRAGVIEEIFFRGLAIEQLTVLTGRRRLSALIATSVFVLMHALFFDWVQLVPVAARPLGQHHRACGGGLHQPHDHCASGAHRDAVRRVQEIWVTPGRPPPPRSDSRSASRLCRDRPGRRL